MKNTLLFFCFLFLSVSVYGQATCMTNSQICTAAGVTYTNATGVANLGRTGCLGSTPNASWFFFTPVTSGSLNMRISQVSNSGNGIDVDYAIWGPFNTPTEGCQNANQERIFETGNMSCSYSTAAVENANINVVAGKFYILIVTNYANQAGQITVTQTGGTAQLSCERPCIDPNTTLMRGATSVGSSYLDMVEGCLDGWMTFDFSNAYDHDTLINYTLTGTATNGTDYIFSYQTSTGSTVLNVANGTIPVTNGQTHGVFNISPLTDGTIEGPETVTLTLTGACGNVLGSYTLNIIDTLPHGATISPPTACNGTTVQLEGIGHEGSTYSWRPPALVSNANIQNPTATVSSNTTFYVDIWSGGCTYTDSVSVTIGSSNNVPSGVDTGMCPGVTSLTLQVPAFVPAGSTFQWSDGLGTGSTAVVTAAGSYSLTTTGSGCSYVISPFIVRNYPAVTPVLRDTTICSSNIVTYSAPDTVNLSNFHWYPNHETTPSISVGVSDAYHFTATDSNGCSVTSSTANLTILPGFDVDIIPSKTALCPTGDDFVMLTASSSTAGILWTWGNDGTIDSIISTNSAVSVSEPGVYILEGYNGQCRLYDTLNLLRYNSQTVELGPDTMVCVGGSVLLIPSGSPWDSYEWSTSETTPTLNVTVGGVYNVTVYDEHNCRWVSDSIRIGSYDPMVFSNPQITAASCYGSNDGSITVSASGGTPSVYTYSWIHDAALNSNTATGLLAGAYTVTATDINNCSVSASYSVSQPTQIEFTNSIINNVSCNGGDNGSISSLVIGGVPPYTYAWSANANAAPNATTVTNLVAGIYTQSVTDATGCTASYSYTVTQPSVVQLTLNSTFDPCSHTPSGRITSVGSGGTAPYQYGLYQGAVYLAGNSTGVFTQLEAGNYSVQLTDSRGCSVTQNVTVEARIPDLFEVTTVPVSCYGDDYHDGEIHIVALSTNGPYRYSIDGGVSFSDSVFTNLSRGIYTVVARNRFGCDTLLSVQVDQAQQVVAYINPSDSTIQIGTGLVLSSEIFPDYPIASYQWSPSEGLSCDDCPNPTFNGYTKRNTYSLTITYNDICTVVATANVTVNGEGTIYIPNAFTPNGDGNNDLFQVFGKLVKYSNLKIFNRWGEKVFDSMNSGMAVWDGTYKGVAQPAMVYTYEAEIEFMNGKKKRQMGSITLIR